MRLAPPPRGLDVDLDATDVADAGLYGDGEPHTVWRAMRAREPVRWQPVTGHGGFWSITRHSDATRVMTDHEAFTSTGGVLLNMLGRQEPANGFQFASTDPPRHGQIRAPIQRGMKGRAVSQHVDGLRKQISGMFPGGGEFDFAEVTANLPMMIIGPLLGIPTDDWPLLSRLVAMSVAEEDPEYQLPGGARATLDRAHRELFAYLFQLVIAHRRRPRSDLIDVMTAMRVDDEPMGVGGIVANAYSLLLGACGAMPHVPSATLVELIRTGGYQYWAKRPELLASGVEEALRWASPGQHFMRVATRAVRLGGRDLAAGEAVVVWLGSVNRDERVFADSFRFDVRRDPNHHMAFGAGHHYCAGSHLARIALRLVFAEIFRRYEGFELAGEIAHVRSTWLAGIKRLPVIAVPR